MVLIIYNAFILFLNILIAIQAVGRQPLEDVNSHIPARDRSMDNILQVLLFEDQASFARGTALNEARDRPEVSVPIQETGYHNEETNQSHDGPQQLLSPNGQVSCTYAEYQTTATSTPRASERYHRPRRASPPNSDVGYPIQGASGQPQNQSMQPQNPVEHACTCPTCQSSPTFQRIY